MPIFGHFEDKTPYTPIVVATIDHAELEYPVSVEFLIDTGADHTLIMPPDQKRLNLPDHLFVPVPGPVYTLGGVVDMVSVSNCTLAFTDHANNTFAIDDLEVRFLASRRGFLSRFIRRRPTAGEGTLPSVLGRDVLQILLMVFCLPCQYLMLAGESERDNYCDKLINLFGEPPDPNDVDPFSSFQ